MKAEIVAGAFGNGGNFLLAYFALQPFVSFECAIQQLARNILGLFVIEILDGSTQVGLLLIK
jgi:hypothetical protein